MKFSLDAAIAATGGTPSGDAASLGSFRICTDTRELGAGDAFLALHGERFDGHAFAAEAVRRGAALLILDRADAAVAGVPALIVDDTLRAYMALASAARARFSGRTIAITGSAGKTTTKVFLAQLLSARYESRVAVAPANENNEIGVSRLLLATSDAEHDVAIVEMGARKYGDVEALVTIARPEFGILTNVGDAHLEIMGSRDRLAETKWALFGRGARAILNADDAVSVARAPQLASPPHWFAVREAGASIAPAPPATVLVGTTQLSLFETRGAGAYAVDVRVPGAHNRANLAAAVAGALELGVPVEAVVAAIAHLHLPAGRFESISLPDGWRIIYDAYNANANGTIAALDAFAAEACDRGIAVLGSMAELGDESVALHERVGAHAAKRVGTLLVGGEYADALARGARRGGLNEERIVRVGSNAEAARWLREHARPGDVVLLKGSRKYKLEQIVQELTS
ncbi:MAG TPA: UDP-N-acetylmuramoyl-tripeptide--D-alanyl-D-alanine ligase [Candidatus Acidoferrales bacterium]|nr:UDP-N-acetylmuramoyl-tripeptide--D-alanyl-D-alanine ligase [Candidatus Acidoferrales bacterium]